MNFLEEKLISFNKQVYSILHILILLVLITTLGGRYCKYHYSIKGWKLKQKRNLSENSITECIQTTVERQRLHYKLRSISTKQTYWRIPK
jgi:hypothetical protein